jgi:SAM-dependent methyltransferase
VAGEFYDDERSRAAYLRHRHGGVRSPNVVMEEPNLLEVLGDLSGARVLDLGCGDGSTAPVVSSLGASSYLGVDTSAAMIELARVEFSAPGVVFRHGAIEDLGDELGLFDLVLSRMALHYVADFETVVSSVQRVLARKGRFVFSVSHPVITSHAPEQDGPRTDWTVDDYFVRGPRERAWFGSKVVWHHRTVEDYLGALIASGFGLEAVRECEPDPQLLGDDESELERRRRVPLILLVAARTGT